jgi:hypothetical protein
MGIDTIKLMTFWGSYMPYLGTVLLGTIAVWQNTKKSNKENMFQRNISGFYLIESKETEYKEDSYVLICMKEESQSLTNKLKICYVMGLYFKCIDNRYMQKIYVEHVKFEKINPDKSPAERTITFINKTNEYKNLHIKYTENGNETYSMPLCLFLSDDTFFKTTYDGLYKINLRYSLQDIHGVFINQEHDMTVENLKLSKEVNEEFILQTLKYKLINK